MEKVVNVESVQEHKRKNQACLEKLHVKQEKKIQIIKT